MSVIQQEAYDRIIKLSDDKVRILIELMDMLQLPQDNARMDDASLEAFLQTAGQIGVDGDAITRLREESLV